MNITLLDRLADENLLKKVKSNNLTIVAGVNGMGKTTLVTKNLPEYKYVSLTEPYHRMNAFNDPEGWFEWLGNKAIIDDISYNAKLCEYIYDKFIKRELKQKIVITTNHYLDTIMDNPDIIVPVLGLSNRELIDSNILIPAPNPWIIKGGDPKLLVTNINPYQHFQQFITESVERLQAFGMINKPGNFVRLLKMLAARVGMPIVTEELAELCDVSIPTIKTWINLLEKYYIIYRWYPYHNDFGKRINKRPIFYYSSTGMAAELLNIRSAEDLEYSPYKKVLFSNAVISDIMRKFYNLNPFQKSYYWYEQNRNAIDLILETKDGIFGWVIVNSYSVKPLHARSLERFVELSGANRENMKIIYLGKEKRTIKGFECIPWNMF